MSDCTVLIPTYFANQMTANCIHSVISKIVGVKVNIFKNDIGWLKASNQMMQAVDTDVILLNDDTVVLSDLVKEMSSLAYSDPEIGIVGGKALAPDANTVINYGVYVARDGNTAHRYYGQPKESLGIERQSAVEGSCMFIKREVLDKIGYFDEGYGMGYREEIDLCFRAREAGYKIVSCPTAEYIHYCSQTNSPLGIHNDTFDYFMSKWGRKLKLGLV
jgi:O-antigen biosynthesis protein